MYTYQKIIDSITGQEAKCVKRSDGSFVPTNAPENTDYQSYLKWLEEGNTPEPAEETQ